LQISTSGCEHCSCIFGGAGKVAGNDPISGAEQEDTKSDKEQGHSIYGFTEQIKKLPAGKYKVMNGEIVPE